MNRIILKDNYLLNKNEYQIVDKKVITHVLDVLKAKVGDELKATLVNSSLGMAIIKVLEKDKMILEYEANEKLPNYPQIDLLVGLSRPPTCKKLLEHATSMGAQSFNFFKAELSEKSYLESKLFKNEKYREYLDLGLSQSAIYTQEPKVNIFNSFPNLNSFSRHQKFVLSLETKKTFHDYRPNLNLPVLLAIGPERGWTQTEEDCLEQLDFLPVSIGRSTLRVEQACFSALAQLEMLSIKEN